MDINTIQLDFDENGPERFWRRNSHCNWDISLAIVTHLVHSVHRLKWELVP